MSEAIKQGDRFFWVSYCDEWVVGMLDNIASKKEEFYLLPGMDVGVKVDQVGEEVSRPSIYK